jgi:hypothetical protein
MKSRYLLIGSLALSFSAFGSEINGRNIASIFEDNIDAREAFTASLNCQAELKQLSAEAYISNVSGKFKQVKEKVSTKTYTVSFATGGFVPGPPP